MVIAISSLHLRPNSLNMCIEGALGVASNFEIRNFTFDTSIMYNPSSRISEEMKCQ